MKLTVARKELYEGLQIVSRAVSAQSTLEVLRNVLIEPGTDCIKLAATDLELAVEVLVPAHVEEGGVLTVPARTFSEIVAALPEADVSLANDSHERLTVACRRSTYHIAGLSAEEFPPLPEVASNVCLTLSQPLLKDMIKLTVLAASDDTTRPILTGVCCVVQGQSVTLVATDTHRLAYRRAQEVDHVTGETTVIIPRRALGELERVLEEGEGKKLEIRIDQNQILFRTERVTLVSRLIEGQFPRYERVIPQGHNRSWTLQREDLLGALRRARIVARDAAAQNRVVMQTEGENVVITAEAASLGTAREEIAIEREGDDLTIAFNVAYMLAVLGVLETEAVRLDLNEPLNPAVLRPVGDDDYLMVVMPMQVQ